jgi:SPP1 gp7 family putative phage head morphogenesis protein
VIADPLNEGRSVRDISKLLQEQAGYSKSRAELTARDQTLKLYGQIQEERQQKAGITKYVWTTSQDERVRPDHADLDGTVQAWDDPPVVDKRTGRRGHPGFDYQCRCTAVPVLDDDDLEAGGAPPPPEPVMQPSQAELDLARRQAEAEARRRQLEAEADARIARARAEAERQAREQAAADARARAEAERQAAEVRAQRERRRAVLGVDPPAIDEAREAAARVRVVELSEKLPQVDSEAVREARRSRFLREQRLVDDIRTTTTQAYDQLEFAQKAALDEYTGGNFRAMRALDLGATAAEVVELGLATAREAADLSTQLEGFREAQRRLTVYRPTDRGALYRGISIKSQSQLEQLLTSETIEFSGSVNSASYNHSVADGFAAEGGGAKVILEMPQVDKAVSAIYDSNGLVHEYEMIVGKSKWRIVGKRYDFAQNTYLVELEQIIAHVDELDARAPRFGETAPNKFVSDGSDMVFG